ncbi:MAG: hypothetical protein M3H12_07655, partial [Chromatiales bacterium]
DKRGQKGDLDVPFCILSITTRLSLTRNRQATALDLVMLMPYPLDRLFRGVGRWVGQGTPMDNAR